MTNETHIHYDLLGRQIQVGQGVVFAYGSGLAVGLVTKLNPKMVQIRKIPQGRYNTKPFNKYPQDITVISEADLTMYLLRKGT